MFELAYITIEDKSSTERMDCVLNDLLEGVRSEDYEITKLEEDDYYFVIKVEYEDWDDVIDICASATHLLLQYGAWSYSVTCRTTDIPDYN